MCGHAHAPRMPDVVAVMERAAMPRVERWSVVRAKRRAVPDTVAMASDRRNHDRRKRRVCVNVRARRTVE